MLAPELHPAQPEWAHRLTADLPIRWKRRLFNKWDATRRAFDADILTSRGDATRTAAHWLLGTLDKLRTVNIPLDATDADICARAETLAKHCLELAGVFREWELRAAMETVCAHNHVTPPYIKGRTTAETEVNRMACALWWRRQLRKAHARSVESAAISIGYVNKTRDIYVSNESLARRRQQVRRNNAMLEATKIRNEDGFEQTLAEASAKSTSNKAIKRGELMTRIAGFERIAVDCGHVGLFLTMTCPSRMHKWRTVADGKVIENAKYDGTTPKEAQAHLSKTWSRQRAALARCGVRWYGFRIAEPNHDGTPHWHILVFFDSRWNGLTERAALPRICAILRSYALRDSGNEKGAKKHRVDFRVMDPAKGTAAGYIAKYVAKNIDGYAIEKDLFGNEAITASMRVEAWAATHGIRQFQQIGGPPVTVWREMRRVKELPSDAPAHLIEAHKACNKRVISEDETESAAWDKYCLAQGGVFCGRDYRIRLALEDQAGEGRYGEPMGQRPVGVETAVSYRDGIVISFKNFVVRSVRHIWEILRRVGESKTGGIAPAWTRVNNCTREDFADIAKKFEAVPRLMGPMPKTSNLEVFGPFNWPELNKEVSK
ncbi:MAG: replication endonuclease [Pseudomonadota bacterium]